MLCPSTRGSIQTTIATDVKTLAKAWHSKIKVTCPHCSEVHNFRVCEAYVGRLFQTHASEAIIRWLPT